MEKYLIKGGKKLFGEVEIPCAKNSYLAILAACMLCSGKIILHKCPKYSDIVKMLEILIQLGCEIEFCEDAVIIDTKNAENYEVPKDLAHEIRSSIFLLGAIIGKLKKAKVCYPGGCEIGARPIDLHLKGLRALGIKIKERHGYIECDGSFLNGSYVHLDFPSVGATENIMMAAVFASGKTEIHNPAKEPEIVDLQNFINSMGGKVYGAGSDCITIIGVESLHGTEYTPISDRIIAGTLLIAGAACGGDLTLKGINFQHNTALITKFQNNTCKMYCQSDRIRLVSDTMLTSFGLVETMPYPGFPTDLQAQTMTLQTISKGTCVFSENLFEMRYKHVPELIKMGADIRLKDRVAIVNGVDKLYGAEVKCCDLRGGAALTIAGLVAEGYTTVNDIRHIDRGYYKLEDTLSMLGADIKRFWWRIKDY